MSGGRDGQWPWGAGVSGNLGSTKAPRIPGPEARGCGLWSGRVSRRQGSFAPIPSGDSSRASTGMRHRRLATPHARRCACQRHPVRWMPRTQKRHRRPGQWRRWVSQISIPWVWWGMKRDGAAVRYPTRSSPTAASGSGPLPADDLNGGVYGKRALSLICASQSGMNAELLRSLLGGPRRLTAQKLLGGTARVIVNYQAEVEPLPVPPDLIRQQAGVLRPVDVQRDMLPSAPRRRRSPPALLRPPASSDRSTRAASPPRGRKQRHPMPKRRPETTIASLKRSLISPPPGQSEHAHHRERSQALTQQPVVSPNESERIPSSGPLSRRTSTSLDPA